MKKVYGSLLVRAFSAVLPIFPRVEVCLLENGAMRL